MSVKRLPLSANPLVTSQRHKPNATSKIERSRQNASHPRAWSNDQLPEFQRHQETTNIELFYDLFFVANLTTFGGQHEINSKETLTSYAGFFCVLWFTWCQTSLFDVRFVVESVLERMARACHLGVMVGLAVVGPNFNTNEEVPGAFRAMSLVLMGSRLCLCFQYLLILWHVRYYKNTRLPLALIAGVNFIAAAIYLGVAFAFGDNKHSHAYRSFYVIAVFEVAGNIVISSMWKVLSFEKCHLAQRMILLTLIILGEGVISITGSLVKIVANDSSWTAATIGTVISSTAIVYISYMLYFDSIANRSFAAVREQIWAFLHFPLHLALVLFLEGTSQLVLWHKIVETATGLSNGFLALARSNPFPTNSTAYFQYIESSLNASVQDVFDTFEPGPEVYSQVQNGLSAIGAGFLQNDTASYNAWWSDYNNLFNTLLHLIFGIYGFESEGHSGTHPSAQDAVDADIYVIGLVARYFFITAGLALIGIAILSLLSTRKFKREIDVFIRFGVSLLLGLGLTLLAIMVNTNAWTNFGETAWVLPLVLFCYFIALVVIHIFPRQGEDP